MVRNSSAHLTCSRRLAFAEGRIGLTKPTPQGGNPSTLVCNWSPRCFISLSRYHVDTEDDKEETTGHRPSLIMVCWDDWTDFLAEPFGISITYVDPDVAGKRVGENNSHLFSQHWPRDDESILLIVTSIVVLTIWSIMHAVITHPPDPGCNIRQLSGCWEEPHGDGWPHTRNHTPIFDHNIATKWGMPAMKYHKPRYLFVIYRTHHANGQSGAQTAMCGAFEYFAVDDILPPPAEDMINNIG